MQINQATIIGVVLIFCRFGACISVVPGLSSPRIFMRARLLATVGVTLALAPALLDRTAAASDVASVDRLAILIFTETAIGLTLGLMARLMMAALETLAVALTMSIGMGSMLGPRIDEQDSLPQLAAFVTLSATTLIFITNQHWEIVRALADSYGPFPVGSAFNMGYGLKRIVEALSSSFLISLRICSPFLIFGFASNFAFGLVNKLAPAIPIFFVSVPFILAGGLALLYLIFGNIVSIFLTAFADLLAHG